MTKLVRRFRHTNGDILRTKLVTSYEELSRSGIGDIEWGVQDKNGIVKYPVMSTAWIFQDYMCDLEELEE